MKILLMTFNARYVHTCLALYSLLANLEDKSGVSIQEYTINMPLLEVLHQVHDLAPDHIMISTYIWNRDKTEDFLREAAKVMPQTAFYLGGPEASHQARYFLDHFPALEGVFCHEAEDTFSQVVGLLRQGKRPEDLAGLAGYLSRADGPETRPTYRPSSFSKQVFPYSPEQLATMTHKLLYYEASRGCPFSCSYCLSSIDKSLRQKPLEKVICDLDRLVSANLQTIKFVDRTFNVDRKRAYAILSHLAALEDTSSCFHFEVSADLFDEAIFSLLETMPAGRIQFEIGLQSTNKKTLAACQRKTDLGRLKAALLGLRKNQRVVLHLDLIAGLPYEDEGSFFRSFNQALAMRPHVLNLGFLKLLKGAPLNAAKDKYGIVHTDQPPYEVLKTHCLSFSALGRIKKIESALETYYNSQEFPLTTEFLAPSYDRGQALFYLGLAQAYEEAKEEEGAMRGLLGRHSFIYGFCQDQAHHFPSRLAPYIRDILFFDALLAKREKGLAFLLSRPDQARLLLDYGRDKKGLAKVKEALGLRDVKETFKKTRLMVFDRAFVKLIMPWLKDSGRLGHLDMPLAAYLGIEGAKNTDGQDDNQDDKLYLLFDHRQKDSLYSCQVYLIDG